MRSLEQIALLIRENIIDFGLGMDEAIRVNSSTGWTVELPGSVGNDVVVRSDIVLTDAWLSLAFKLAKEM